MNERMNERKKDSSAVKYNRQIMGTIRQREEKALLQQLVHTHAKMQTFSVSLWDSGQQTPQIQQLARIIIIQNAAFPVKLAMP